jgi:predicted lipoprotein with Yx(FWY)xxD motif
MALIAGRPGGAAVDGACGRRAAALAVCLILAGCATAPAPEAADDAPATRSSASRSTPQPEPSPSSPSPTADQGLSITTGASDFGTMLFDDRGQAIYLFDRETTAEPECYGDCAAAWPPVLTTGPPQADGDVRPGLLGATERKDGSRQVTYAGHPLYFYAHEGPGQVLCHDVSEFGGVWLVVTPAGTPAP